MYFDIIIQLMNADNPVGVNRREYMEYSTSHPSPGYYYYTTYLMLTLI